MKALYPYRRLTGDVGLNVVAAAVDRATVPPECVDVDHRTVSVLAVEKETWEVADVRVEVTAPQTELGELAASGISASAIAILHGGATNMRRAVALKADDANPSRFTGRIQIERPHWWGRLVLGAAVVATVDGVDGRVLGSSDQWTVSLDDVPRRPVTGNIPVEWQDFRQPTKLAELRRVPDEPAFLHLDPSTPVLYLNESFTGLRALFDERTKRSQHVQALHDQTRSTFATEAWTAMFTAALASAAESVTDEDDNVAWPDAEWQKNVLEILLNRMYPETSPADALTELVGLLRQGDAWAHAQERLLVAVSEQVGGAKLLRGAIARLRDLQETV